MGRDFGLADRIRAEGVDVVEVAGWQGRGVDNFDGQAFVYHHTAGGRAGAAPSLGICINGASYTAPGPLCNVLQSREDGEGNDRAFVIASGKANHAGVGSWRGVSGNNHAWGLEIEHVGTEPLPDHRRATAVRIGAACLRGMGATNAEMACQHSEWSWPPGSKIDVATEVDPGEWRRLTTAVLQGAPPLPTPPRGRSVIYDETTSSGGHQYWQEGLGGLVQLPERVAGAHIFGGDLLIPLTSLDIISLAVARNKQATVWLNAKIEPDN